MSQDFTRHVCADISLVGLKEAAIKLGDSGSYILADLAALPFKDLSFDGVLASHTLYHVAKELQPVVLRELVRVTGADKNVIVFYSSRHNLISLMHKVPQMVLPVVNFMLYPFNLHVRRFSPYFRRAWKRYQPANEEVPALYAHPHNPRNLVKEFPTADVTCLMSLTRYDTDLLRKFHLSRVAIPVLDFLERKFPHLMVYFGKYSCIRINKSGSA